MDNVVINITEITDSVQINVNEAITQVVTDGVTVTGNGTISNPLVAAAGSGDMLRATYDPTNKNADAFSMENMVEGATKKILTSAERTKLNNLSGTNTGDQDLTPYLTSATAAATYQPIGAYLTTISGLNISQLTNDSGYITSSALSPYQPILVSGTNIKTINGTSILGAGDITIGGAPALTSGSVLFSDGTTISQDNTNFFWDNTNKRLGIGTNTPTRPLEIKSSNSTAIIARMVNMFGAEFVWGISGGSYGIVSNVGTGDFVIRMTGDDNKFRFKPTGQMGIGVVNPNTSALLELSSTTRGFLLPRMTSTQASAIASPAEGLLLYVTNTNATFTSKGWWGYNGTSWEKLNN